jgi:two-component system cell cycle sensor histidine kinase/response regulator CckA
MTGKVITQMPDDMQLEESEIRNPNSEVERSAIIRVLLIEDNPGDARLIREMLVEAKAARFDLECADRLSSGLERLAEGDIDVVLLDLGLPDSQGLDTLGKMLTEPPEVPIIVILTGLDDEALAVQAVRAGAQDYLVKGQVDSNLLVRSMRYAIGRKRAEEALRRSEEKFRYVVENSQAGIFIVDDAYQFIYVNDELCRILGYSREEIIGQDFRTFLDDDSRQLVADRYVRRQRGEEVPPRYEFNIVRQDGGKRQVEISSAVIKDSAGNVWTMAQILDITERKRAEELLRESEERFRQFFENEPEYCYMISSEGVILDVNRATLKALGYKKEELVGKPLKTVYAPESLPKMKQLLARWKETGELVNEEMVIVTKEGNKRAVLLSAAAVRDKDGKVLHSVSVQRDITERKQAEDALRESEERMRRVVQNMPVMLDALDEEGRIVAWNRECERVTGYSAEEITGNPQALELLYPDAAYLQQLMAEWAERGNSFHDWEIELTSKDGSPKTVSWTNISEHFPIPGWASWSIGVDITERKHLEEQLRQAQKMEAVGRLAGGIAHDFNNLLTVITGFSEILLYRHLDDGDPLRQPIEEIQKAGQRAASLTRQLMAFSRRQVLQLKVLNLNATVADMDKMLQRLISEDIDLVTVLDPELGPVKADPGQIEQVVVNLVVNARDAMPQGGQLTIETANVELDEAYAHQHVSVQSGPYVMLAVSDTGIGMDEEIQSHIFEPFFTTKEFGQGTGLGLSTVYGIVKQSGGYIWVYSESGQGTTFKIYLPRVEEDVEPLKPSAAPTKLPQGSETILVVEDDQGVRTLAREVLEMDGYTVLEARHGGEALLICEQHGGPIHLMVTDVVMPQMSGRELAERLEPLHPEMKVLYMSGYTDRAIVRHCVLEPGMAFLQKPFRPGALARQVRQVLDALDDNEQ